MAADRLPPINYIREALDYDPTTGVFRWRERPLAHFSSADSHKRINGLVAGKVAGTMAHHFYIKIGLSVGRKARRFYAHRLAWLLVYGHPVPSSIDHIDGDGGNNRISNLRASSMAENIANSKLRYDSTTRVKGVWKRGDGQFQAKITVNYRQISIGTYATLEEAAEARRKAANQLHGAFARHD